MYIIDFLQSREGRTWTAADTAEVRRVILQIESVAEAIVQRHMPLQQKVLQKLQQSASKKRCQCAIEDYRDLPSGDTCPVCRGEVVR